MFLHFVSSADKTGQFIEMVLVAFTNDTRLVGPVRHSSIANFLANWEACPGLRLPSFREA